MLKLILVAVFAILTPAMVDAWGAAHVGYTRVGPRGVTHTGRTAVAGPGGVRVAGSTTAAGPGGVYRAGGAAGVGVRGAGAAGYRYQYNAGARYGFVR